ncbi:MAG: hypothetical protein IJH91_06605 [Mogibacterium sp.]|nr:hypothetical protein [Mogibacterium sp.]
MEDSRMNDILCMALESARTGKLVNGAEFRDDREIDLYVGTLVEMEATKDDGIKRVWMPE